MGRASWGSTTGDMSGLFASLIDEQQRRIEASVERDIQRSAEQQAAEDNDMYDKWQNGLISDDEWLAYVEGRVKDTKGDPKEHSEWVKTLREHTQAIRDAQMESAYEAGELSIHKLISYYDHRMGGLEEESPEYRELQTRFYGLIDQRDSYYIEDQANHILNKIQRGEAGYGELRAFYQSMLKKVRPSSPLYRQIKQGIQSINEIGGATSGGSSGGSGGGGGSGGSGGSGGGDGSNDPYSVASRAVLRLWRSGNVFAPYGPDIVASTVQGLRGDLRTSDTAISNALTEDSVIIENLLKDAADNPDAEFLVVDGQRIPNTLEYRQALMNQGLRNYDFRIAVNHALGRSNTDVRNARRAFVDENFKPLNDADAMDYWKQSRQNYWEDMEMAAQNPNPEQALKEMVLAGRHLLHAVSEIKGERTETTISSAALQGTTKDVEQTKNVKSESRTIQSRRFPEEMLSPEFLDELDYSAKLAQFSMDAGSMTPEEMMHYGSIIFDDPDKPASFWLTETDIRGLFGSEDVQVDEAGSATISNNGKGLIGQAFAARGLRLNEAVNAGDAVVGEPYMYIGMKGQSSPIAVPISEVNDRLGVNDWQDGSTRGGWEKVGGKTQWIVRVLEEVPTPVWFQNDKNRWMTASEYEKLGRDPEAIADAGYTQKPIPEFAGWMKFTASDGTVWYKDPADGFLYPKAPPFAGAGGLTGPIFNYGEFVNESGEMVIEDRRLPASTARGFVAYFGEGVSAREAQMLTEQILENPLDPRINPGFFHPRDDHNTARATGITVDDVVGMYWSEQDDLIRESMGLPREFNVVQQGRMREQNHLDLMLQRAEMRRKAEVESWINQRYETARAQREFGRYNPDINLRDFATEQIEQGKQLAGIRMGNEQRLERLRRLDNQLNFNLPALPVAAPPTNQPIAPVPLAPSPHHRRRRRSTTLPYVPAPTARIGGFREGA